MFADESVVQGSTLRALRISHIISSDLNTLVPVLPTSILDFLKEDRPRSSVRQHKDRDKTCCWTWTKMCIRNTWFMWSTTTPLWWTETWEQGNCYETKQLQQLKTIELWSLSFGDEYTGVAQGHEGVHSVFGSHMLETKSLFVTNTYLSQTVTRSIQTSLGRKSKERIPSAAD